MTVIGSREYAFEFPPSAAGKTFTIALTTAAAFGAPAPGVPNVSGVGYLDFFKLGPNGFTFADPVLVRPKDPTGMPPFAMLYPDGSTAVSVARFTSGTYSIAHFSGLGIPGSPAAFCAHITGTGAFATNQCASMDLTQAPPNVLLSQIAEPGKGSAGVDCDLPGGCGVVSDHCCAIAADIQPIASGKKWCVAASSGAGENWTTTLLQTCDGSGSDAGPPKCRVVAGSNDKTCSVLFVNADCGKTSTTLACDGTTCSCGVAQFPQGTVCSDGAAMSTAILGKCP